MSDKDSHGLGGRDEEKREYAPPSPANTHSDFEEDVNNVKRNRKLAWRMDKRIMPICAWIYLLNFLDRGNIGNAKVLNAETGDSLMQKIRLTDFQYAITLTLFGAAYAIFEVPANIIMKRYVRPSLWLGFLLFTWGCFTIGFGGVQNFAQVIVIRFFIGVFEAGFFPAIIYLIAFWYRQEERSLRIAFILASGTASGAFGGCIAYGVGFLNHKAGLEGFRWLSILEGLLTVVSSLLVIFGLPDYPSTARFLSAGEKAFAKARLDIQGGGFTNAHATRAQILETCLSPRMVIHYISYVTDNVPLGSLTFFTPQIVKGLGYTSIRAQLFTVPPWICGYIVCLIAATIADRYNARGWVVTVSSTIGGVGWLTAGLLPAEAYSARYGCLFLCACGAFPSAGPLSAWVTCNVPTVITLGIAIGLNNGAAGIGQIITQWIWKTNEASQGYPTGNFVCAGCSFATVAIALGLRWWYARMNRLHGGLVDERGRRRACAL